MRIIWGKITLGKWDEYEAAYKKATEIRGDVDGLLRQWLVWRPDAGFSMASYEEQKENRSTSGTGSLRKPINRKSKRLVIDPSARLLQLKAHYAADIWYRFGRGAAQ